MKKYKLNIDRPAISSEDIQRKADFNSFIEGYQRTMNVEGGGAENLIKGAELTKKAFIITKGWYAVTIVATALTFSLITYIYTNNSKVNNEQSNKHVTNKKTILSEDRFKEEKNNVDGSMLPSKKENGNFPNLSNQGKANNSTDPFSLNKESFNKENAPQSNANSSLQVGEEESGEVSEKNVNSFDLSTQHNDRIAEQSDIKTIQSNNESVDRKPELQSEIAHRNEIGANKELSEKTIKSISKRQQQLQEEITTLKSTLEKAEAVKSIRPQQANPSKYHFYLDISTKEFPEIPKMKGILFEVGEENKSFNKKEVDGVNWKKVELGEGTRFGNYSLNLSKGKITKAYIVYPVYEAEHYISAMKEYHESQGAIIKMKDELKNKKEELKSLSLDEK